MIINYNKAPFIDGNISKNSTMNFLQINHGNIETIEQSFLNIASHLFNDFKIQVNNHFYRLLDIEFYYFSEGKFDDPYSHRNDLQKETGKWYFHESGLDITFGADGNYGGILIRGIGKVSVEGKRENGFIEYELHGPMNVTKELTRNFHDIFNASPNAFGLVDISRERLGALMPEMKILKTNRLGLSVNSKDENGFYQQKPYRFIGYLENGNHKFKEKERVIKTLVNEGSLEKEAAIKILGYNIAF